ncbi:MAG TPA: hypothetical protein VFY23_14145 [Candidatus Limnocylindrales bacterium]|nr:hypothetical protein [Candidatus Limnocylindrales bacterium]
MNALAIYRVNEHVAELMAEADAQRTVRTAAPKRSRFELLASVFGRKPARPAALAAS